MSIITILAALGMPMLKGFLRGTSVTSAANELVAAFNLARSEAVTRGDFVSICKSSTYAQPVPLCDGSASGWQMGWMVFVDRNADGLVTDANSDGDLADDNDDRLVRIYQAQANTDINWSDASPHQLTYAATGFLTSASQPGTLQVVFDNNQLHVDINSMGRIRTFKP